MIGDLEPRPVSLASGAEARAPWLLVVARGHARLVAAMGCSATTRASR